MLRPPQFPRFGRTQPVPRVEDEVQEPNTPPLLLLSLGANVLLLLLLLLVNLKRRRAATPGRATTTAEAAKLEAELATAKQKRKSGANDRPPIKSLKHAVEELRGLQVAYRYIEAGELLDQLRSELARIDVHGGKPSCSHACRGEASCGPTTSATSTTSVSWSGCGRWSGWAGESKGPLRARGGGSRAESDNFWGKDIRFPLRRYPRCIVLAEQLERQL